LALLGLTGSYHLSLWDAQKKREIKVLLEAAGRTRLEETARATFPQDQGPRTAGDFTFLDNGSELATNPGVAVETYWPLVAAQPRRIVRLGQPNSCVRY
jgi:hypothetical protein